MCVVAPKYVYVYVHADVNCILYIRTYIQINTHTCNQICTYTRMSTTHLNIHSYEQIESM